MIMMMTSKRLMEMMTNDDGNDVDNNINGNDNNSASRASTHWGRGSNCFQSELWGNFLVQLKL